MKLEEKIQVLQFCSAVLNTVFLILGLSVSGCAVWILFDKGTFLTLLSSEELKTVAGGLLIIGLVVVAVGVVGCVGAHRENRFFLLMYMAFLIVLVLGQLFIMLVLLVSQGKIGESLDAAVDDMIVHYGDSSRDRLLDKVQRYTKCCGMMGPADWLKNSFIQNGCKEKISDWLEENALTIVGMDVSLMVIQVLQFVVAVYLYRAVARKARLKGTGQRAVPDQNQDYPQHGEQNQGYIDADEDYVDPTHPAYYHDNHDHIDPADPEYYHDNHDYIDPAHPAYIHDNHDYL